MRRLVVLCLPILFGLMVHGRIACPEPVPEKKHSLVSVVTGAILSIVKADASVKISDVWPGLRCRCILAKNTLRAKCIGLHLVAKVTGVWGLPVD